MQLILKIDQFMFFISRGEQPESTDNMQINRFGESTEAYNFNTYGESTHYSLRPTISIRTKKVLNFHGSAVY